MKDLELIFTLLLFKVGLGTFFVLFENGYDIVGFLNFLPLLSVIFVIYGFNAGIYYENYLYLL